MPDNQDYHKRPPKPQTAHRPPWPCAESDSHPGSCLGPMSSLVDTSLTYFSEQQRPLPHFSLEVSLVSTSQVCSPEVPISMSLSLLFGGSNSIVSLPPPNWPIQSHLVPPHSRSLVTSHPLVSQQLLHSAPPWLWFPSPLVFPQARPPANHPTLDSVTL